jgi:hypothetical protein
VATFRSCRVPCAWLWSRPSAQRIGIAAAVSMTAARATRMVAYLERPGHPRSSSATTPRTPAVIRFLRRLIVRRQRMPLNGTRLSPGHRLRRQSRLTYDAPYD